MSGITISRRDGKMKASAKLLSAISSFIFEQEFGELKSYTRDEIQALKAAQKAISEAMKRAK